MLLSVHTFVARYACRWEFISSCNRKKAGLSADIKSWMKSLKFDSLPWVCRVLKLLSTSSHINTHRGTEIELKCNFLADYRSSLGCTMMLWFLKVVWEFGRRKKRQKGEHRKDRSHRSNLKGTQQVRVIVYHQTSSPVLLLLAQGFANQWVIFLCLLNDDNLVYSWEIKTWENDINLNMETWDHQLKQWFDGGWISLLDSQKVFSWALEKELEIRRRTKEKQRQRSPAVVESSTRRLFCAFHNHINSSRPSTENSIFSRWILDQKSRRWEMQSGEKNDWVSKYTAENESGGQMW